MPLQEFWRRLCEALGLQHVKYITISPTEDGKAEVVATFCFDPVTDDPITNIIQEYTFTVTKKEGTDDAKDLKTLRSKRPKDNTLLSGEDPKKEFSDTSSPVSKGKIVAPARIRKFVEMYNTICKSLPRCISLTPARIRKIDLRLKEHGIGAYAAVFERMEASPFLIGKSSSGWRADLDWLVKNAENTVRIMEGRYDRRRPDKPPETTKDPEYDTWIRQVEEGLTDGN